MVREKLLQGGGLVPLSVGEDHVPVTVEGKQCTQSILYLLTANLYSGTSELCWTCHFVLCREVVLFQRIFCTEKGHLISATIAT